MASVSEKGADVVPADLKTRVRESYDAIAATYNDWGVLHHSIRIDYVEKMLEKLLAAKPAGQVSSVLELGCGCGIPVSDRLLTTPDVVVTANDMSSTQIKLAKENLAKHGTDCVSFVEGDMSSLEFSDGSFDAVVGMYSIIHLPRDEQKEILRRIAKWLKPGGFFLANFGTEVMPGTVNDSWLHEEAWMYWSGWGSEATLEQIKENRLEVFVKDERHDEEDAPFLWVLAQKK